MKDKREVTYKIGGDRAQLFGIPIFSSSNSRLLMELKSFLKKKNGKCLIYTPNPEIIVESRKNLKLKEALMKADVNIPDGVGVVWASRIYGFLGKEGGGIRERIAGADLAEELVKISAAEGWRVMLLGAGPGVAEGAAVNLRKRYRGIEVKAMMGYERADRPGESEEREVRRMIGEYRPAVLLVAFGQGKQEGWLDSHRDLSFRLGMGVGGTVDFWAGKARRAPGVVRSMGMEWLWRLVSEPWRWRRQLKLLEYIRLVVRG